MNEHHVVIVGGGIAGLATAYYLQKEARRKGAALRTTVIDAGPAVGGKIVTEHYDGFVVEGGPDSFLRQKPWAGDLCRELGLGDELVGTNPERKQVFVVHRGRLHRLPDGVMLIVPTRIMPFLRSRLLSWPGKLRMGLDFVIPPRRDAGDESVGAFVRRRLGREALEKIATPLLSGIHVSDPEHQSILATFPRFRDLERDHGSLIRGMLAQRRNAGKAQRDGNASAFLTLRGGLQQLVRTLEQALDGTEVLVNTTGTSLERLNDGRGYRVGTSHGIDVRADAVVLATPAYASAGLVAGLSPSLSRELSAIGYVSTATVSLGFDNPDVDRMLAGYGFVVPPRERRRISACTWTSSKFDNRAPAGSALLRCFVGGPGQEQLVDLDDAALVDLCMEELGTLMDLHISPSFARVFRWRKANPQYEVGHLDRVHTIAALCRDVPGLYVTGSAYGGVGIPDCVRQAQETAQQLAADLLESARPTSSPGLHEEDQRDHAGA